MMKNSLPEREGRLPTAGPEEKSISYGELLFREMIAIELLAVVLVCLALVWNAPLEQLADPLHTANPAKAPWYFTGLQELLHYFPPFVAGVILPTLVVLGLIVVPFFNVNIKNEMLWSENKSRRLTAVAVIAVGLTALLLSVGAWDATIPVVTISVLMALAAMWAGRPRGKFQNWLSAKPLSFWVMTWFLMEAVILTTVGAIFRGPGWVWVWPWRNS
jgi:menaquinol-cytochrome c reductase cytochrome b/c subunit